MTATLTEDLKASILVESFLQKLESAKQTMPPATYRKLTKRLAELEEAESNNDYFGSPRERIAHGLNPITGHDCVCQCNECRRSQGINENTGHAKTCFCGACTAAAQKHYDEPLHAFEF